jgi:hypothetical protein
VTEMELEPLGNARVLGVDSVHHHDRVGILLLPPRLRFRGMLSCATTRGRRGRTATAPRASTPQPRGSLGSSTRCARPASRWRSTGPPALRYVLARRGRADPPRACGDRPAHARAAVTRRVRGRGRDEPCRLPRCRCLPPCRRVRLVHALDTDVYETIAWAVTVEGEYGGRGPR